MCKTRFDSFNFHLQLLVTNFGLEFELNLKVRYNKSIYCYSEFFTVSVKMPKINLR